MDLIIDNDLIVYSSPPLVAELLDVIGRSKFTKYLTKSVEDYIKLHLGLVTLLETKPVYTDSPDVKDNFLFDLALQSKVPTIVTGDRKLLAVHGVKGVNFISLSAFKESFS